LTGNNQLIISVVSVGEIKSLAIKNNWGARKIDKLQKLLGKFVIADINVEEVIDKYAEIDAYSQGKLPGRTGNFTSRNMGKNDLWIAATGAVLNVIIVTTDGDFDHLDGKYVRLKKVNLDTYR
jgi:predicted nucleic acid-binding protein